MKNIDLRKSLKYNIEQVCLILYLICFIIASLNFVFIWATDPLFSISMHGYDYIYYYGISFYEKAPLYIGLLIICAVLPSIYSLILNIFMLFYNAKLKKELLEYFAAKEAGIDYIPSRRKPKEFIVINKIIIVIILFCSAVFYMIYSDYILNMFDSDYIPIAPVFIVLFLLIPLPSVISISRCNKRLKGYISYK